MTIGPFKPGPVITALVRTRTSGPLAKAGAATSKTIVAAADATSVHLFISGLSPSPPNQSTPSWATEPQARPRSCARRPAMAALTTIARSPVTAKATAQGNPSGAGSFGTDRGGAGTGAATGAGGRPTEIR